MTFRQWLDTIIRPKPKPPPPTPTGSGQALLDACNAARHQAGYPPLELDSRLQQAASQHAADMAASGVMSHAGFPARLDHAGYPYASAAENVAAGGHSAEGTVQQWLDSPPHRANLLGPYHDFGGGGATARDGTPYWCADFGTQR